MSCDSWTAGSFLVRHHRGQSDRLIVADGLQSFKLQVSALQLPLVVLLEQECADQARDCGVVGEDAHDVGAALDLGVGALQREPHCNPIAAVHTIRLGGRCEAVLSEGPVPVNPPP